MRAQEFILAERKRKRRRKSKSSRRVYGWPLYGYSVGSGETGEGGGDGGGLEESLTQPYKLVGWDQEDFGYPVKTWAALPDGTNLVIQFEQESPLYNDWNVEFKRDGSIAKTGQGDAQRIFATVLSAIRQFVQEQEPNEIIFSAIKNEDPTESRRNLYTALAKRYATGMGYSFNVKDYGLQQAYVFKKIKKDVAEGKLNFEEGDCPIFAIALHRLSKMPLMALVEYDEQMGSTVLIHAYVKLDDRWRLDASGETDVNWMLQKYPNNGNAEEIEINEKDLLELGYGKSKCPTLQQVLPHAKEVLQNIEEGQQGVAESLDQPYRLAWKMGVHGDVDAYATLPDGTPLSIMFNKENEHFWTVEFYRSNSQGVTGEGDSQRIFATVLGAIKKFVKKYQPRYIVFSAVKEDDPTGRRASLYERMVQKYARQLGYEIEVLDEGYRTTYTLYQAGSLNEQDVTEGSEIKIPAYLYHATYRPLLKSIKQHGLGGDKAQAKWEDSKPGVVYLATDPNVAESYAEASDVVPDEWLDQIVILKVAASKLDKSRLFIDQNVQDNEGDTLEYHGVIPFSNISLYKKGVAEDIDYQRHLKLINAHMEKMGYKRLGGGRDAQVYAKQEGSIIKILIPQDGKTVGSAEIPFLEFYKYCRANQKNPHLPKFGKIQGQDYADFHLDGERFVQIAQERLSDIPAPSEYDDMLFDMINSVENNTPLEQKYQGYELFYKTLKSVAQRGRELGFENDFIKSDDDFNIMLRGKTLVITDPWLDASLNESVAEGVGSQKVIK